MLWLLAMFNPAFLPLAMMGSASPALGSRRRSSIEPRREEEPEEHHVEALVVEEDDGAPWDESNAP